MKGHKWSELTLQIMEDVPKKKKKRTHARTHALTHGHRLTVRDYEKNPNAMATGRFKNQILKIYSKGQ